MTGRLRVLDASERFGEILFGLIMVLTFTGSLSAAESGHTEVRTMLIGALGCNFAWGIVDGIMYILDNLGQRGRGLLTLHRVIGARSPETAHGLIAEALPGPVASVLRPDELESIRKRLADLPEPPRRGGLVRDDFLGALGIFLLVFLSTFPVVIPFLVMRDAMAALRVSNVIAIAMLFVGGYFLGKSSGYKPARTGLVMVGIGAVLVAITIALGG
ncbi:MAG TPA: VIT1/CCC1 transporter family protein [Thermoanaerobaculia bacterium]|jgi:hypothetical protein